MVLIKYNNVKFVFYGDECRYKVNNLLWSI